MDVTVGSVDGAPLLLLGTISAPLKLTLRLPLIQPPFSGGFVVTLVFGCTLPKIGINTELKLLVCPVVVVASPLMPAKMLTSPLQVLSPDAPQPRALSFPMM
jgi:hypothetical protein